MSQQTHMTDNQPNKKHQSNVEPAVVPEVMEEFADTFETEGGRTIQAARLNDARIPLLQRRRMVGQMGEVQGNSHTMRVMGAMGRNDQKSNHNHKGSVQREIRDDMNSTSSGENHDSDDQIGQVHGNVQMQEVIQRDEDDFELKLPDLSLPEYDGPHLDIGELTLDAPSSDNLSPTLSQLLEIVEQNPNQDLIESLLTNPAVAELDNFARLKEAIPELLQMLLDKPDIDNPHAHQDRLVESMQDREDGNEGGRASRLSPLLELLSKHGINISLSID